LPQPVMTSVPLRKLGYSDGDGDGGHLEGIRKI